MTLRRWRLRCASWQRGGQLVLLPRHLSNLCAWNGSTCSAAVAGGRRGVLPYVCIQLRVATPLCFSGAQWWLSLEPGDEKGDPVVGQGRGFRRNTSRARGIRVGVFSSSKRLSSRSRLLATGCRSLVTDSPGAQLGALNIDPCYHSQVLRTKQNPCRVVARRGVSGTFKLLD